MRLSHAFTLFLMALTWQAFSDQAGYWTVIGNGSTTGTACAVSSASGQNLGSFPCGHVFKPFNVLIDSITVPYNGRIGQIPRSAAIELTVEQTAKHELRREEQKLEAAERVRSLGQSEIRQRQNQRAQRLASAQLKVARLKEEQAQQYSQWFTAATAPPSVQTQPQTASAIPRETATVSAPTEAADYAPRKSLTFDGAVIREQGITFMILIVKPSALRNDSLIQAAQFMFGMPVVLMSQDYTGNPTYYGRGDIVDFLAELHHEQIPWKTFTITY